MVTAEGVTHSQTKEVLHDEYEPAWFVKKVARSPAGRRGNPAGRPEKPEAPSAHRADFKGLRAPKPNVLEDTMSKNATQRREEKLAKELRALAVSNPTHLKSTWKNLLEGWSLEAIRRGRLLQQDSQKIHHLPVFDVLRKAERLLTLCGQEVEKLVGSKTRELLTHDCGKAFAIAAEPHLYWLSNAAHNEQLMKLNYKPPR